MVSQVSRLCRVDSPRAHKEVSISEAWEDKEEVETEGEVNVAILP